jgi:16S rRNA (guanine966-N2)-methyltransferase
MDIVFLDPPFDEQPYGKLFALLAGRNWLSPRAAVYVEQDVRQPAPELPAGWTVRREKKAGNVRYSLLDAQTTAEAHGVLQPSDRQSPGIK